MATLDATDTIDNADYLPSNPLQDWIIAFQRAAVATHHQPAQEEKTLEQLAVELPALKKKMHETQLDLDEANNTKTYIENKKAAYEIELRKLLQQGNNLSPSQQARKAHILEWLQEVPEEVRKSKIVENIPRIEKELRKTKELFFCLSVKLREFFNEDVSKFKNYFNIVHMKKINFNKVIENELRQLEERIKCEQRLLENIEERVLPLTLTLGRT